MCTPWGEGFRQTPQYTEAAACESEEKKKEVVYQVPCKDCHKVYIEETKRTGMPEI